jgi:chemotaxis response regulator CheB
MKAKSVAKEFPVVCVGGSAGGLDAYTRLLRDLPPDTGVAIVIVNHLRTVAAMASGASRTGKLTRCAKRAVVGGCEFQATLQCSRGKFPAIRGHFAAGRN